MFTWMRLTLIDINFTVPSLESRSALTFVSID
jgi:hypothetical protein